MGEEGTVAVTQVEGGAELVVRGEDAEVTSSAVGAVIAGADAEVTGSMLGCVVAKGGVTMSRSGSLDIVTKGDVDVATGGTGIVLAAGDVRIENGFAGVAASRGASVRGSRVGMLLALKTEVSDDSRVIMDGRSAAIFGLAFGAVMTLAFGALFGWGWYSLRRWRRSLPPFPQMPHVTWRRD